MFWFSVQKNLNGMFLCTKADIRVSITGTLKLPLYVFGLFSLQFFFFIYLRIGYMWYNTGMRVLFY